MKRNPKGTFYQLAETLVFCNDPTNFYQLVYDFIDIALVLMIVNFWVKSKLESLYSVLLRFSHLNFISVQVDFLFFDIWILY